MPTRSPRRNTRSKSRAGRTFYGTTSGGSGGASTPDQLGLDTKVVGTMSASTEAAGWTAAKLIDGAIGNTSADSWSANAAVPAWVKSDLGTAKTVTTYRVIARTSTGATSCPSAWTLEGSNDNSAWTTLDTQSGLTWSSGQERVFTAASPGSYRYYRLSITAAQAGGGTFPSFTEWTLEVAVGTVTTLVDWYKAGAITGVADGGTVGFASIVDSSPQGRTFTSGSGGTLRKGTGYNSRDWVQHAGAQYYEGAAPAGGAIVNDWTFFGIIKTTSSGIQSLLGATSSGPYIRLDTFKLAMLKDSTATLGTSTLTLSSDVWTPVIASYKSSTGAIRIRVGASSETISGTAGLSFGNTTRSLGRRAGNNSEYLTGGWVELGRYNSVLSSADETSLMTYLNNTLTG